MEDVGSVYVGRSSVEASALGPSRDPSSSSRTPSRIDTLTIAVAKASFSYPLSLLHSQVFRFPWSREISINSSAYSLSLSTRHLFARLIEFRIASVHCILQEPMQIDSD